MTRKTIAGCEGTIDRLEKEIRNLKNIQEGQASIIRITRDENERSLRWVNKLIMAL